MDHDTLTTIVAGMDDAVRAIRNTETWALANVPDADARREVLSVLADLHDRIISGTIHVRRIHEAVTA